ncbi:MAG: hypothetical protein ACOCVL_01950, partial [Candidatus Sumerlaeota bacterium]
PALPGWLRFLLAANPFYPSARLLQQIFLSPSGASFVFWFLLLFWNFIFAGFKMLTSPATLQVINASRALHKMMKAQEGRQ